MVSKVYGDETIEGDYCTKYKVYGTYKSILASSSML